MAQHDYNIEDQNGFDFLVDLNNGLTAIATSNSGPNEPAPPFASMLWFDTANDLMKVRDESNSAWIVVAKKDGNGWTPYRQGVALGTASVLDVGTAAGQIPRNSDLPSLPTQLFRAIGEPFPIWDDLVGAGIPDNSGTPKFVRLTAGQSGAGGFNEGLLTAEAVAGSAPLVTATAQVAVGPMAGQDVPLLNTEGSFVRPGTSSRALQFDQMQRIWGNFSANRFFADAPAFNGALSRGSSGSRPQALDSGNTNNVAIQFDSVSSPNARTSSSTGGETRSKNRQATYYMRIV